MNSAGAVLANGAETQLPKCEKNACQSELLTHLVPSHVRKAS